MPNVSMISRLLIWVCLESVCLKAGATTSGNEVTDPITPGMRISVRDFGAVADDGQNDAPQLRKALEFARAHPGITLYFPPGVYNLRDDNAIELMNRAMNGEFGQNPESTLFKEYFPYARGLDFRNISGLTIEASGVILLCEGWMEPISLDQTHDITLRGLTIDYKRRAYSEGPVVAVGDGYFDAKIEDQYPINPRMPIPRVMFWDRKAQRMIGDTPVQKFEIVAPQTVRIYIDKTHPSVMEFHSGLTQTYVNNAILPSLIGSEAGLMHSMHFRPAILIQQAGNIRLENVTIHSQPGMGIVGYRSSNVTLSGVRIVPAPGAAFSTTTDATHFTSMTGLLRIENSVFEGQGDDATNIHNYYWSAARIDNKIRYLLTLPVRTHAAVLDYPDIGDHLEVLHTKSLEPVGSVVVTSVALHVQEMQVEVELAGDLPPDLEQYYLSDVTRLPKVDIVGNTFLSCRCRGVLIKSRNVLIEQNRFLNNGGTAIHVAAEESWREGVTSANVVIRNNLFIGNGYVGAIHEASAIAVNIETEEQAETPLHHGLLIEGNSIVGTEAGPGASRCIFISRADGVTIRSNELSDCRTPISTEHSEHVAIHDNTIVADPSLPAIPVSRSGVEARDAEQLG
jgi:hypothetical protein